MRLWLIAGLLGGALHAAPAPEAPPASPAAATSTGEAAAGQRWAAPATLEAHFVRHGADFGARDAAEYARLARELYVSASSDTTGRYLIKEDARGRAVRIYDPDTNTFGAYNRDGSTRTFFKPRERPPSKRRGAWLPAAAEYWRSQPGRERRSGSPGLKLP